MNDRENLRKLANIINTLIGEHEPTDAELDFDDNYIALYDDLHNLRVSLRACGYDSEG